MLKLTITSVPVLFVYFLSLKHTCKYTNWRFSINQWEADILKKYQQVPNIYLFKWIIMFLTLSSKVEKGLWILFVWLSVQTSTLINILRISWNLYILFIFDVIWTVLKTLWIGLFISVQRHTKVSWYVIA